MSGYDFPRLKAYSEDNKNHVSLTEEQLNQFEVFSDLLLETNKITNLTAIRTPDEVELKHFIDSLLGVEVIKKYSDGPFSLIDIGCGPGFPGLPLKLVFPKSEFVLVDSIAKKTNFVQKVIDELDLKQIQVENDRAEFLARTQYREKFDFCTARAVADLAVLLEYCLPFVKLGGYCVLYKSGEYQNELDGAQKAMETLGGALEEVVEMALPFSDASRSMIVIKKVSETPDKYPRKAGKPEKSPIK